MEQLKKVRQLQEEIKRVSKLKQEIKDILFETFINVPYSTKKVNTQFNIKKDAYYPILNVPKGFIKEEEKYCVMPSCEKNDIIYKYFLKADDGTKIEIIESTILSDIIKSSSYYMNSYISLEFYIPSIEISYNIVIDKEKYSFSKKINHKEFLKPLIEDKIAVIESHYFDEVYYIANKKYKDFIGSLYISEEQVEKINNLQKLTDTKKQMIEASSSLNLNISVVKFTGNTKISYYTTQFSATFCYENCISYMITIAVSGKFATERKFCFVQLENGEYLKDKISFNEVLDEVLKNK